MNGDDGWWWRWLYYILRISSALIIRLATCLPNIVHHISDALVLGRIHAHTGNMCSLSFFLPWRRRRLCNGECRYTQFIRSMGRLVGRCGRRCLLNGRWTDFPVPFTRQKQQLHNTSSLDPSSSSSPDRFLQYTTHAVAEVIRWEPKKNGKWCAFGHLNKQIKCTPDGKNISDFSSSIYWIHMSLTDITLVHYCCRWNGEISSYQFRNQMIPVGSWNRYKSAQWKFTEFNIFTTSPKSRCSIVSAKRRIFSKLMENSEIQFEKSLESAISTSEKE